MIFSRILASMLTIFLLLGSTFASGQGKNIPELVLIEMFLQKNQLEHYSGGIKNIESHPVHLNGTHIGFVTTFNSQDIKQSYLAFFACRYDAMPDYAQLLDSEWYVSDPIMHMERGKQFKMEDLTDTGAPELVISGVSVPQGAVQESFRIYSFIENYGEGYSFYKPTLILETDVVNSEPLGNKETQIRHSKVQVPEPYPAIEILKVISSRSSSNDPLKVSSIDRSRYYIINNTACTKETKVVPFKSFQWEEVFYNDINAFWELGSEKVLPIPSNPIEIEKMQGFKFLLESCKKRKTNDNTWEYFLTDKTSVVASIFYDAKQGSNKAFLYSINLK